MSKLLRYRYGILVGRGGAIRVREEEESYAWEEEDASFCVFVYTHTYTYTDRDLDKIVGTLDVHFYILVGRGGGSFPEAVYTNRCICKHDYMSIYTHM